MITIKQGNDRSLKITVKKDGAVVDITGWKFHITAKAQLPQPDADAVINKIVLANNSPNEPTDGIAYIVIDAADTETKTPCSYKADVLAYDADGKKQSSQTFFFTIEQRVTEGE